MSRFPLLSCPGRAAPPLLTDQSRLNRRPLLAEQLDELAPVDEPQVHVLRERHGVWAKDPPQSRYNGLVKPRRQPPPRPFRLLPDEARAVDRYRRARGVSLLAITFSDLVGYTPLCERLDERAMSELRAAWAALVRDHVERENSGVIVKWIGDAVLSVHAEPTSAVVAALSLHHALSTSLLAGEQLQLRTGIHLGQVAVEREGFHVDVFGRHVNRASRVQATADPDQVLVTEPVADNVRGWLDSAGGRPVSFTQRTTHVLKGIDEPVTVFVAEPRTTHSGASKALRPKAFIELIVREGGRHRRIVLDAERDRRVIIGRSSTCDIRVTSDYVSAKHALIDFHGRVWTIQDLRSANGTLLDGVPLIEPRPLATGHSISVGDADIEVVALGRAPIKGTRAHDNASVAKRKRSRT